MIDHIASNLRHLRALHGLTQGEIADKAGLSRNAYRAIETGKAAPRENNLHRLADALKVSPMDLMRDVPSLKTLRFRSNKAQSVQQRAEREELVTRVAFWLKDFNELEELLNERQPPTLHVRHRGDSNPRDAAEKARTQTGLSEESPVFDICDTIEAAGIKLMLTPSRSSIFFGLSVGPEDQGPAMAINTRPDITVERRIFSAAHELGHLLLHPGSYTGEIAEENSEDVEEEEANTFASHFLMPPAAFVSLWDEYAGLHFVDRVLKIKRHFMVSYATVLRRLIETGLADQDIRVRFRHLYAHRFGKELPPYRQEPYPLAEPDFREDRLDLLVRKALEREMISLDRAAEILGLSVEEMRDRIASWTAARG